MSKELADEMFVTRKDLLDLLHEFVRHINRVEGRLDLMNEELTAIALGVAALVPGEDDLR